MLSKQEDDPNTERAIRIRWERAKCEQIENKIYLHRTRASLSCYGGLGERQNSYFLRAHKKGATNSDVLSVQEPLNDGSFDIKYGEEATDYMMLKFKELFGSPSELDPNATIQDFMGPLINKVKKVPIEIYEMLNKPITYEEL